MNPEVIVPTVLPLFFLVFGFFWTLGFVTLVWRRRSFLKWASETTGEIVAIEERHYPPRSFGSTGSMHHYPTVRFQTSDGRVIDCKINISLHDHYTVGQQVIVNYDPANPCKRTQLGSRDAQPRLTYALFIILGVVILLIGFVGTALRFFV